MNERQLARSSRPRVRAAIEAMKPYVPGKSLESVQRELGIETLVKMNQNENPLGPSPRAIEAAGRMLTQAHTYPEGTARALRDRLAVLWNLPADWFLVGNGSDEIFRLLAEVYLNPADVVVVPAPSFAGYPLVAELMGAEVTAVPLIENTMHLAAMMEIAIARRARIVFLCRPNSPTGGVFTEDALRTVLPLVPPDLLVVLDEAYAEFDETVFDARSLLIDFPNLIITRTFSKIYGLAGLRLGYGIMRPELITPLLRARDPFSVNLPAAAAGIAALDDDEHRQRSVRLVHEGKRALYRHFDRLGLRYVPTQANFVLFHTPWPAVEVYEALLRRGFLIRPCALFGLPHSLRVTVGTPEENEGFVTALSAVIDSYGNAS
jgi:histidinol-phosphate aminotransferase